MPEVNTRVGLYRPDFLWREAKLVVEVDSYRHHSDREAQRTDRVRDRYFGDRGFSVRRFMEDELEGEPDGVAAHVLARHQPRDKPGSQSARYHRRVRQGRIGLVLAAVAIAVGGGVAGAVVVAPELAGTDGEASISARQAEERDELVTKQKAFRVAKKARGMARGAREMVESLVPQVDQALSQSQQALSNANIANSRLDAAQAVSKSAPGQVTTDSESAYVPLDGGPQVTVNVPQSGLIEVFASATIGNENDPALAADGAVALFEDGQKIAVSTDPSFGFCDPNPDLEGPLFFFAGSTNEEVPIGTPAAPSPFGCGIIGGVPGGVLLDRAPGQHVYELRYGDCGCEPQPAAFRDRVLRVIPRP